MSLREHTNDGPALRWRLRLVAAGCAAIALLGAAGGDARASACAGANVEPTGANRQATAGATLCLLNVERRSRGLHPLGASRPLASAARRHARDMVRNHYFSHTAPGGSGPLQRIRRSGYLRSADRWVVGENIAWGTRGKSSAKTIVRAWMHSTPHRRAILKPSYRDVGIGVVTGVPRSGSAGGATYATEFGVKH